jgi:transposase
MKKVNHDVVRFLVHKLQRTHRAVAKLVGCSSRCVGTIARNSPKNPSKTKSHIKARRSRARQIVKKRIKKNTKVVFPNGSTRKAAIVLRSEGFQVTKSTVHRDLLAMSMNNRKRRFVPSKSPEDYRKRVKFARHYKDFNPDSACFVDESYFDTNEHCNPHQWCDPGEIPESRERVRWPAKIMMFMAIAVGFRKLVVFELNEDSRLTAARYKTKCLIPLVPHLIAKNLTLLQDGARPHMAKANVSYLANKGVQCFQNWPPRSPCLNPIEELFADLKPRVAERMPGSTKELIAAVKEEFAAFPQEKIDKLCRSFSSKLRKAIRTKGRMVE